MPAEPGKHFQSGQGTVEFALTAVTFLLLLFGVTQMASVVFAYNSISNAAREAARYAIANGPNSPSPASTPTIQAVAIEYVPSLKLSDSNVSVSWPTDPNLSSRQDVKIVVSYTYPLSIPFISTVNVNLTSTSQMLASQ